MPLVCRLAMQVFLAEMHFQRWGKFPIVSQERQSVCYVRKLVCDKSNVVLAHTTQTHSIYVGRYMKLEVIQTSHTRIPCTLRTCTLSTVSHTHVFVIFFLFLVLSLFLPPFPGQDKVNNYMRTSQNIRFFGEKLHLHHFFGRGLVKSLMDPLWPEKLQKNDLEG